MRKIVIAIDSLKGCLTSAEANAAAVRGIRRLWPEAEVIQIPVSDGGEGWLAAFGKGGLAGKGIAEMVEVRVHDPLMRLVTAHYLMLGDTAVIEMAQASGLGLLKPTERDPVRATTYGTGELVVNAVRRGCRNIIVGLGGSATSDCGMGMIQAVTDGLAKDEGGVSHRGRGLAEIKESTGIRGTKHEVDYEAWDSISELADVRFTIATDVTNPLCGKNGAAQVFARQKFAVEPETGRLADIKERAETGQVGGETQEGGQTKAAVIMGLDARARRFAEDAARHFGFDRQEMAGAGAAGGLGYAFLQFMNATRRSGIDILLDAVNFDDLLKEADAVVTGEGAADRQTLMGKVPYGILQRAKAHNVPVMLVAGRVSDREALLRAGFARVECINPEGLPVSEAMKPEVAKENLADMMLWGNIFRS